MARSQPPSEQQPRIRGSGRETRRPDPDDRSTKGDNSGGGFYNHAKWYDILHRPGTAEEFRSLEAIEATFAKEQPAADRVWLEPACGTGRLLLRAAQSGIRVVGVDITREMSAYAERALQTRGFGPERARILNSDMRAFISPWKAAFAYCTINSIRHLSSDAAMLEHLSCIARSLDTNGIYVVGIGLDSPLWTDPAEDIWHARRGSIRITQTVQYLPPDRAAGEPESRRERVHSHLQIALPSRMEYLDSTYTLRTWSLDEWLAVIERSELAVLAVTDEHGTVQGDSIEDDIKATINQHATYAYWVLRRRADEDWSDRGSGG